MASGPVGKVRVIKEENACTVEWYNTEDKIADSQTEMGKVHRIVVWFGETSAGHVDVFFDSSDPGEV